MKSKQLKRNDTDKLENKNDLLQNVVDNSIYLRRKKEEYPQCKDWASEVRICSENEKIDDLEQTNTYAILIRELNKVKFNCFFEDKIVPYELPVFYSLDFEKKTISLMSNRIQLLKNFFVKPDTKSIALDWRNVGGDISEAINRCREECGKY